MVDVVAVAAVAEAAVVAEVAVVVEVGKLTPPYGVVRAVPATPGVAAVCATEGDDQNTESTGLLIGRKRQSWQAGLETAADNHQSSPDPDLRKS